MSIQNKVVSFAGVDIEVASIVHDDQVWLLANPFARMLGFQKLNDVIRYAVTSSNVKSLSELGGRVAAPSRGNPIQKRSKFINRAGLFELIDQSRMPKAIEFKHWVNNDLLPTLCETGEYSMVMDAPLTQAAQINAVHQVTSVNGEPSTWYQEKIQLLERVDAANKEAIQANKQAFQVYERMLQLKPKLAVWPERDLVRHILLVMKKPDVGEYSFVRCQRRGIARGRQQAVDKGFTEQLAEFKDIPNGVNVMNRLKECIPRSSYNPKFNTILCDNPQFMDLVHKIINEL
ncbi:baculovirus repeated ORF c [Caerostris extrusa]|uniref:Baculovirus repeated ORF c n=1 Tax=Caerostris extrusa TaxID=172846 RepID=A0AAV4U4Y1_CAEEX|nr:baculovirus repeated ORF c [Caerostris extrusa]